MQHLSRTIPFLLVLSLLFQWVNPTSVGAQATLDLEKTVSYLKTQQQPDGGFPGLSGAADPGTTARALIAFHVAGIDASQFVIEGVSALDYLSAHYADYIYDQNGTIFPGNAGLVLTALSLFDVSPEALAAELTATLKEDGSFSSDASSDFVSGAASDTSQALAVLGLTLSGVDVGKPAITFLLEKQMDDGTWDSGFGSDPDTTALVVVSLLTSGYVPADDPAIQKSLDNFRDTQLENGGWRPGWDTSELNVDTTGWVSLALVSAGENMSDWQVAGLTPQDALASMQKEDGSIGGEYVNVYSTVEALLGFAIKPLTTGAAPQPAQENKAGLAITLPDGNTLLRCVTFTGESISGIDLLQSSGVVLDLSFDPAMGYAVCGIESQGCKSDNCFCGAPDYWSYWVLKDGNWVYREAGASNVQVNPGDVDGWKWGSDAPPVVDYEMICGENALQSLPASPAETVAATQVVAPTQMESPAAPDPTAASPAEPVNTNTIQTTTWIFLGVIVLLIILIVVLLFSKKNRER